MRKKTSRKPARVISITSGKGGVGKTNTTVNLALALANMGNRVLVLDGDLGLANVNIVLGFRPKVTLHDVLNGRAKMPDILVSHQGMFDVIPAASGISAITHLKEEEQMLLVALLDEYADKYDYMLVDTAAGIGDNVQYFNLASEEVIIVVDHEPTSLTDAYALIKVLSTDSSIREFNVVVNRTPVGKDGRAVFGQLSAATDKFLKVRLSYLGSLAEDDSVSESVKQQKPYLSLYPSAKVSRDLGRLAKKLESLEGARQAKGGLQFFFRALVEFQSQPMKEVVNATL